MHFALLADPLPFFSYNGESFTSLTSVTVKTVSYTHLLIIAGLSGCEKEIKDFDGEEGVYFYVQWGVDWYDTTYWAAQPYTKVEFIKKGVDEQLLKIRVQATGRIKDYDRKFRIVVDQDSTTAVKGENYLEFDEWQTIKGGWSYADVPVTVKNSEALDEVERNLVLRLLPSEDFTLSLIHISCTSFTFQRCGQKKYS